MNVSVIIPTYQGAHRLPNVLQSLLEQSFRDFELVVVVDGSRDDTQEVLDEWLPNFREAKRIVRENGGRSRARNSGAASATGELLIFIDDDMRLEPDCLEQHMRHHEKFPGSLVSGAQVYDEKKAATDFQQYKCMISRNWYRGIETIYPNPLPPEKLHLTAANFSVSKKVFEKLDGFDERVCDMEDFLLAYKALQQNIPVYYLHAAFGWHDDFADIISMQNRYAEYKRAAHQAALYYPELQKMYPRYATTSSSAGHRLFASILTNRTFIRMFVNRSRIPRDLRYRLYGAIMHARANRE